MTQAPHITVRQLTQVFDSRQRTLTALTNVDLEVERGAFVSVIGPSGGGKTTLLRVIGGLLEPTSGTILVDGVPPLEAQRRKAIGYVLQDPSLLPWRTVLQNIGLPLQLNSGRTSDDADEPERLMEAVDLVEFRDYYPHQLSGGMKHRVALARALVLNPPVLLMDEPLGALDEITRSAMRYELLRLWELSGKSVIFVTHSIPEAVLLSDRVIVMSSQPGRVVDELTIDLPRPREESPGRIRALSRVHPANQGYVVIRSPSWNSLSRSAGRSLARKGAGWLGGGLPGLAPCCRRSAICCRRHWLW